ncbi:MAG: transporter substrate-binding domain-containing protein [Deltaproteobacteria bacterium]
MLLITGCTRPLRVGMSGDYPPFTWRGAQGQLQGFDVEMAGAWAAADGRRLEVVPFAWPELSGRLAQGDFDLVMSGVTVRGDRLIQAPMTRAVAEAAALAVVRELADEAKLDLQGVRVAVNRGGHLEKVARAALPHAEFVLVDDNRSLPARLASGEVDVVVTDSLELASFTPRPHLARVLRRDRKAYWVAKDQPELADRLDEWLAGMEASGRMAALRARHFPMAATTLSVHDARLTDLVARRLQVMPFVAEVKAARGLAIDDAPREAIIEQRARAAAGAAGLDVEQHLVFVRAQFAAAKAVQRQHLATARGSLAIVDLGEEIRPAIDRIDRALRAELKIGPAQAPAEVLVLRIRALAALAGLSDETLLPLARALRGQKAERLRVIGGPPVREVRPVFFSELFRDAGGAAADVD